MKRLTNELSGLNIEELFKDVADNAVTSAKIADNAVDYDEELGMFIPGKGKNNGKANIK